MLADLGWTVNGPGLSSVTLATSAPADTVFRFLPNLYRCSVPTTPSGGINGRVLMNGSPAAGVTLLVDHYVYDPIEPHWDYKVANTVSNSLGQYSFTELASLEENDVYSVYYLNQASTPGRLWAWFTPDITSYTAGNTVTLPDFDIADVTLSAPSDGAMVDLPELFSWVRRPSSPSDSYAFEFYDDSHGFYSGPLGYVSQYELSALPSGFSANTPYYWDVLIFTPAFNPANPWRNGLGVSLGYRQVTFTNTGALVVSAPEWSSTQPRRTLPFHR
jgi:hypothetical protein